MIYKFPDTDEELITAMRTGRQIFKIVPVEKISDLQCSFDLVFAMDDYELNDQEEPEKETKEEEELMPANAAYFRMEKDQLMKEAIQCCISADLYKMLLEKEDMIKEMVEEDLENEVIAKHLKVPNRYLKLFVEYRKIRKRTIRDVKKAKALMDAGWTIERIAKEFGVEPEDAEETLKGYKPKKKKRFDLEFNQIEAEAAAV